MGANLEEILHLLTCKYNVPEWRTVNRVYLNQPITVLCIPCVIVFQYHSQVVRVSSSLRGSVHSKTTTIACMWLHYLLLTQSQTVKQLRIIAMYIILSAVYCVVSITNLGESRAGVMGVAIMKPGKL